MKVRASVKPICEKCKVIKEKYKVMVICENLSISRDKVKKKLTGVGNKITKIRNFAEKGIPFILRPGKTRWQRDGRWEQEEKMARIAGVDLPRERVDIGLTYIFGIGRPTARAILEKTGIDQYE